MNEHEDRDESLDRMERDAERERAAFAGSVEALRGRLGMGGGGVGAQLSAGARGYAERRRGEAMDGVWRRIEEHPLETVALAAGVAYPVVRIVTKIPAPILLLGAGVALAGRGGPSREERVEVVVEPKVLEVEAGPDTATASRQPRVSATGGGTSVRGSGAAAGEDRTRSMSRAGERAIAAGRAGGEGVVEAIRRNPAIAGGASLLVGAALAAMLPRTRVEGRAFGEAAEDVRERARDLAAEGVEAGRRALGAAAEEAERQNLTAAGAKDVVRDVGDRVGAAARDAGDEARGAVEGSREKGGSEDGSD